MISNALSISSVFAFSCVCPGGVIGGGVRPELAKSGVF